MTGSRRWGVSDNSTILDKSPPRRDCLVLMNESHTAQIKTGSQRLEDLIKNLKAAITINTPLAPRFGIRSIELWFWRIAIPLTLILVLTR